MRIGITGGAGYLGDALMRKLAGDNQVLVFDTNAPSQRLPDGVRFVRCDITDPDQLRGVFDGLDVVFHRAGLAGNLPSMVASERYFSVNTMGTVNVLQSCVTGGVKRFVFDSTEFVYGVGARSPVDEAQEPVPVSIYGATKRMCELLVSNHDAAFKDGAAILRFCRVRDANKRDVITHFAERVLGNLPITLAAGGELELDFLELEDATNAAVCAAMSKHRVSPINVGPGKGVSVREIVRIIETVSGCRAEIRVADAAKVPSPPAQEFEFGPVRFWLDRGKAEALLGWSPRIDIVESIRRTVVFLQAKRGLGG